MKIEYSVIITGNQHESRKRSMVEETEWCCDSMFGSWSGCDSGYIAFNTERHTVELAAEDHNDAWGDNVFGNAGALQYCPWCGELIETVRTSVTDNRIKACAAELKRKSPWQEVHGEKAYCQNQAKNGSDYCGRHSHLEEDNGISEAQ